MTAYCPVQERSINYTPRRVLGIDGPPLILLLMLFYVWECAYWSMEPSGLTGLWSNGSVNSKFKDSKLRKKIIYILGRLFRLVFSIVYLVFYCMLYKVTQISQKIIWYGVFLTPLWIILPSWLKFRQLRIKFVIKALTMHSIWSKSRKAFLYNSRRNVRKTYTSQNPPTLDKYSWTSANFSSAAEVKASWQNW